MNDLPTGDRDSHLMRDIWLYQETLRSFPPEKYPLEYTMGQKLLGDIYFKLKTGDRDSNLMQGIQHYQEILRFWIPEETPLDYVATHSRLGKAYLELKTGDRDSNLMQAIQHYQEILRLVTPETAPLACGATQTMLGLAYSNLSTGGRDGNRAQAIRCYQEALRFYTPETQPLEYATIQGTLGNVYQKLLTGDRASNLVQAIRCYQEALRFFTPEETPLDYTMIHNNLGAAYTDLPTGDRVSDLTQAIQHYQEALRFKTDPLDYAMTHSNLGNVYCRLPRSNNMTMIESNLAQGIQHYQEALCFVTPEAHSYEYALIQNNLGNAYLHLPTGDRAVDVTQAIQCFREALRFQTSEVDPLGYAKAQHNLGNAYLNLPIGDLVQAMQCYQEAQRFRTPEVDPLGYAWTQDAIGSIYRIRSAGDRVSNRAQAIHHYQEALRFFTLEEAPLAHANTHHNLARLYFDEKEWEAALRAFRVAMDVREQLYRASLSLEDKTAEAIDNADLYPDAAFTAVRCGEVAEALLILERGKTRLLAEALRLRVRRPSHVPDETWNAFEQARVAVRTEQANKALGIKEKRDSVQDYKNYAQAVRNANAALNSAIKHVRTHAPHFLETIDISTIETLLLDEQTALITFCITAQGIMSFVVNQHSEKIQVVEVPTFTEEDLHQLARSWFQGSHRFLIIDRTAANLDAWQETITQVLAKLGERLLTPIMSALPATVERIIFLPSGELFFFPLHAVPLSGNSQELLCDRYQISYAPSLEVLTHVRTKVTQEVVPAMYAVINPEEDTRLLFTSMEGVTIAQLFAECTVDIGRVGTKERVLAKMQKHTYLHFTCHGSYHWGDPLTSGLQLADERLTLDDLQQAGVDLSATRLVTLSACETGISNALPKFAQEYVGIPAGFLQAGVPCVISSLWSVPDLPTELLIAQFYRNHLFGKMDFVAALQEAQRWLRKLGIGEVATYAAQCYRQSTQKEEEKKELLRHSLHYHYLERQNPALFPFEHPYYWAAFTINGL